MVGGDRQSFRALAFGIICTFLCTFSQRDFAAASFPFGNPPKTIADPTVLTGPIRNFTSPSAVPQGGLKPGEIAVIPCGIYKDNYMIITSSGLPTAPIVVKAQEPGCVILYGNSYISIRGDYIEIQGFMFYGSSGKTVSQPAVKFDRNTKGGRMILCRVDGFFPSRGAADVKQTAVEIWGDGHRIEWNSFVNMQYPGELIRVMGPKSANVESRNHLIAYNYFGPRTPIPSIGNGGEIIQIGLDNWDQDTMCTISYNYFDGIDSDPESISVKASSNIISSNTFVSSGAMVSVRLGSKNIIDGNYFFCNGLLRCAGIRVFNRDNIVRSNYFDRENGKAGYEASVSVLGGDSNPANKLFPATRTQVYRNLAVDCRFCLGLGYAWGGNLPALDTTVRDNTFISNGPADFSIRVISPGDNNTQFSGNYFFNGMVEPRSSPYSGFLNGSGPVGGYTVYPMDVRVPNGINPQALPSFDYRPVGKTEIGTPVYTPPNIPSDSSSGAYSKHVSFGSVLWFMFFWYPMLED